MHALVFERGVVANTHVRKGSNWRYKCVESLHIPSHASTQCKDNMCTRSEEDVGCVCSGYHTATLPDIGRGEERICGLFAVQCTDGIATNTCYDKHVDESERGLDMHHLIHRKTVNQ